MLANLSLVSVPLVHVDPSCGVVRVEQDIQNSNQLEFNFRITFAKPVEKLVFQTAKGVKPLIKARELGGHEFLVGVRIPKSEEPQHNWTSFSGSADFADGTNLDYPELISITGIY